MATISAGTALQFNGSNQYVTFGKAVGNTGAAVGSPTWVSASPFTPPPSGLRALQLNGSNQYVTFGAAPGLGAATFTLETWFNRTGVGVGTNTGSGGIASAIPLVTKGRAEAEGSNVDMNYFFGIDATSGKLVADFEEGPSTGGTLGLNHPVSGTTVITSNVWHHAAATYDGQTWKLYLDGVQDGTLTLAVPRPPRSDSIQHAALGTAMTSTGAAAGYFQGILDEARIWNYARTQSDIQASKDVEVQRAGGLIGRWGMNEGTGTILSDSSTFTLGVTTFTLETWFNRTGTGVGTSTGSGGIANAIPLVTKGRAEAEGSNVDMNYFLGIDATSGKLVADFEDMLNGGNHPVTGLSVIQSDIWHHAAATYDGSTWTLYLDGNLEATLLVGNFTPRYDSIQYAALATAMNSTGVAAGFLNGILDETRIWSYARTQAEIQLTKDTEVTTATGLIGRWGMNEGAGAIVGDSSVSGINGNATNAPTWVAGFPIPSSNRAPTVNAGPDQTITLPASASLNGSATDDGLPNATLTTLWSQVSGPGTVAFANPNSASTMASFSDPGSYVLRLTADDGELSSSDTVALTVNPQPPTNSALEFNGSTQYVTFGQAPGLGASNFTIETWFSREGAGVGTNTGSGGIASAIPLVTKGRAEAEGSNVDMNYFLGIDATSGKLVADFEEGAGGTGPLGLNHPISGQTVVTSNVWHHAAATYDGQTWRLYLDGVLDRKLTVGQPARADSIQHAALATAMNSTGMADGFFQGTLDEARIWNYARSSQQIRSSRNTEILTASGLLGRWGMNEGTGTVIGDSSGNSINGTATSGAVWVLGYPFTPETVPPAQPQNVIATAGDASVTLNWSANSESDLAGYNVYRSTSFPVSTGSPPLNGADLLGSPTFTDTTATNGTTYYYVVTAVDGFDNTSPSSVEAFATPQNAPPAPPQNLLASTGDSTITLNWSANSEVDLAGYNVYRSLTTPVPTSGSPLNATLLTSPTYTDIGLANGTRYYYVVTALDISNGASGPSNEVYATPNCPAISAPTNLQAMASDGQVSLTWSASATAVSYNVKRSLVSGGPYTTVSASSGVTSTNYTDVGLTNGATYYYVVSAVNSCNGESNNSNQTSGRPLAVAGTALSFDGVNDYVTFGPAPNLGSATFTLETWFNRTDAGVGTSTGSEGIASAIPLVTKGRAEAEGSNVDMNYFLGIDASTGKLVADFEEGPGGIGPLGQNHPITGNTAITSNVWHHVAATYDGTTWKLYLDGNLDGSLAVGQPTRSDSIQHAALATAMTSTGVAAGFFQGTLDEARIWNYARSQQQIQDTREYQIPKAIGLLGRWAMNEGSGAIVGDSSGHSITGTANNGPVWVSGFPSVPNNTPPAPPQNLAANPGDTRVALYWSANTDSDLAGYNVYRSTSSPVPTSGAPLNGSNLLTSPAFIDNGVTNGTTYYYAVTAVDSSDNGSGKSNEAQAIPQNLPPAAPQNLIASAGDASVTLNWSANSEMDLAGYNLYRGTSIPVPASGTPLNGSSLITNPLFTDIEATNGTTYYYMVTAVDTSNNVSASSTEASAIPRASTGSALDFDGANDYVTFGPAPGLGSSTFTLETWFKREGAGVGTNTGTGGITDAIPLVTKGRAEAEGSNIDMNYFLGIQASTGKLVADFEDMATGANHPVIGASVITSNVWHHAAATYDGTKWQLFLDGNLDSELNVSQTPRFDSIQHAALATAMNSTGVPAGFFQGTLDEARIWNYARSQQQIQGSTNAEIAQAVGLIGRWSMNDGAATTVADTSGSNITGTTTNGPVWVTGFPLTPAPGYGAPAAPILNAPANDATGVSNSPTLDVSVSDPDGGNLTVTYYGRPIGPTSTGPDFTIVALPDTQFYVSSLNGGIPAIFNSQTQWIVDNKASRNIVFVTQLGDCVQNGDNGGNNAEWVNADGAMSKIEDPLTTMLTYGIPYGIAVGNHDQSPIGDPNGTTTFFNQYFGEARFSGREYYRGHYGANNDNHYEFFSASGMDFIVVHLEYDPNANPAVLAWADNLLKTYSNRRAIVVSHYIINAGNPATFGAQGQKIYDALKGNPNLFLMLSGHVSPPEGQRQDTFTGNTIYSLMSDYQGRTNGGNGWLRIMEFSPANNEIRVRTYSPWLNQYETDADSQFTLSYTMQGSTSAFSVIGTANAQSGNNATTVWQNLSTNAQYEWYATVSDGSSTTTGPTWRFTTAPPSNQPPVAANDSFSSDEDTALSVAVPGVLANDTDADGNPLTASVVNGPSHGTLTFNANGSFNYTSVANYNGGDSFTYKANDGTTNSNIATVSITINPVNDAPVAANDSYTTDEDTGLSVAVPGVLGNDTDADGNPLTASVVSGPTHGTLTLNADGSFTYTPSANFNGVDSFSYRVSDGVANSNAAVVSITVNAVNDPPVVTNPGNQNNSEGDLVSLQIQASDPEGGALSYNASGLPDGLSITSTGLITGTVGLGDANYNVQMSVSDGNGGTTSMSFSWSIIHGIIFRSASFAQNSGSSTLVIPRPATVAEGNVMLASVDVRGNPIITPPAPGWALSNAISSSVMTQAIYYKIAGASEPSSYTWIFSTAQSASGGIVAYSGVDQVNPVDVVSGKANASSTSITAPSLTTTVADSRLIGVYGTATSANINQPSGTTARGEISVSAGKNKVTIEISDASQAVVGATGDRVAIADKAAENIGHLVALRPVAPPPSSPPPTPTSLTATAGDAQVQLSWAASLGATSYNVKRSTTPSGPYTVISTAGSVTTTSYTDTGLSNGTPYYYVVSALNNLGESDDSTEVSATPCSLVIAPASLTATAGDAQVDLSWATSSGAASYNVKRSTTSGGPYTTISVAGSVTGISYTDTGASNGTTYYYVVSAVSLCGAESANSPQANATPAVVCPVITVSPNSLPNGTAGVAYPATTITANGGTGPYSISLTSGSLPPGMKLSSGVLSGTPKKGAGGKTYNFTVTATDANGCTGNQAYVLTINK